MTAWICRSAMKVGIRRGPSWFAASDRMTKVTETTSDIIVISPDRRLDSRSRAVPASPLNSHQGTAPLASTSRDAASP